MNVELIRDNEHYKIDSHGSCDLHTYYKIKYKNESKMVTIAETLFNSIIKINDEYYYVNMNCEIENLHNRELVCKSCVYDPTIFGEGDITYKNNLIRLKVFAGWMEADVYPHYTCIICYEINNDTTLSFKHIIKKWIVDKEYISLNIESLLKTNKFVEKNNRFIRKDYVYEMPYKSTFDLQDIQNLQIMSNEDSKYHIYNLILSYYYLGDYDEIDRVTRKYGVDIDLKNNNNDECLIWTCAKELDKKGIEFCISKGSKELSYACAKALNKDTEKSIQIIELLLSHGASIYDVMHRSLTWNYIDIFRYLAKKYEQHVNKEDIRMAIEICGRFGNYNTVKILNNEYSKYITKEALKECLKEAVLVDTHCDKNRYLLIKYLVDQNMAVDNEELMTKITHFLKQYTIEDMDKIENYDNDAPNIYMPDLFKR